jgi:hypothetical protein
MLPKEHPIVMANSYLNPSKTELLQLHGLLTLLKSPKAFIACTIHLALHPELCNPNRTLMHSILPLFVNPATIQQPLILIKALDI